ncbi:glutamine amidotransferase [Frankia sp. AgB32]|uniref:glutamine amidotransferase n=1 Tax=Frankia sp. AgB32 TaxID=631119 RepID=UPI00201010CC|nr:glutamine amidotransferase [Frankia sp. AgB32]MCK9896255.1 glutamine amidotransferase [Frankia sp. AgB32]
MSSRTAVAVRHVPFEDLGILGPLLADRGYRVRYVDAGVDVVPDAAFAEDDLLVVLGGPIGVGDVDRYPFLAGEIRGVADRLARGLPTLGICLGAQLIAHALGAEVTSTGRVEIGYAPLTLTAAGQDSVLAALGDTPVLHWHGDQFAIPAGAAGLAETPGFPYQAFAHGTSVLGLQFHLEAEHSRIERWLIGHAHELATHRLDPAALRADAHRHGERLAERARVVFHTWLDQLAGAVSGG